MKKIREGMKSIRLYLSGKISGDANYCQKFMKADIRLREAGYSVIENPVLCAEPGDDWNTAMRKVLSVMLTCEGVALLPGWEDSKGAVIEAQLALEVGLTVKPIEAWIAEGGK